MSANAGTTIKIRRAGGSWVVLAGYAGGLGLGVTSEALARDGDDDGMLRVLKGNASGAISQMAIRLIEDNAGQDLLRDLSEFDDDGLGGVRIEYPQGLIVEADGLFHGLIENPVNGDTYQGFMASFTQNEIEVRI